VRGPRPSARDALSDIAARGFGPGDLDRLDKADRRLLDQFAYRYTRLQDDMGARLMPAVLIALGEDIVPMPALDRFNRLEQLGWLPSATSGWSCARSGTRSRTSIPSRRKSVSSAFRRRSVPLGA